MAAFGSLESEDSPFLVRYLAMSWLSGYPWIEGREYDDRVRIYL